MTTKNFFGPKKVPSSNKSWLRVDQLHEIANGILPFLGDVPITNLARIVARHWIRERKRYTRLMKRVTRVKYILNRGRINAKITQKAQIKDIKKETEYTTIDLSSTSKYRRRLH